MIYTIASLVSYARTRDERLANTTNYPDSKMQAYVEEAFAVAQDIRPLFAATETYDLKNNIVIDGLTEMEIILRKEPQSIRALTDYNSFYFDYEITANNHVIMKVKDNTVKPDDNNYKVTVKYFYYPLMPLTEIELSVDSYRLVRAAINIVLHSELRDYEQEQYYRNKAKMLAQESSYDLEKNTLDFPDDRFGNGTWA